MQPAHVTLSTAPSLEIWVLELPGVSHAPVQVCLYFINLVLEDYQQWSFMQSPEMVEHRKFYPHRFPPTRRCPLPKHAGFPAHI